MKTIKEKFLTLQEILKELGEVIIAFSGGVDSTFLTKVAFDVLQNKAKAITIFTPQTSPDELLEAKKLAEYIGIRHFIINEMMEQEWFDNNPPNRCYLCKNEILRLMREFCKKNNLEGFVIEGSNFDDLTDYRPGLKAVKDQNVKSPLLEAKLTKGEIRNLSQELRIPCWDKPASPCLVTRFPFGEKITKEKLQMVYNAEKFLHDLGITEVRVRVHQKIARIETNEKFYTFIVNNAKSIVDKLLTLGFEFVTLDLSGYQQGSMNRNR